MLLLLTLMLSLLLLLQKTEAKAEGEREPNIGTSAEAALHDDIANGVDREGAGDADAAPIRGDSYDRVYV